MQVLSGASLIRANLVGASFNGAKLFGARLDGANLKDETLKIPTIENIHQTIYEACNQDNALDMSTWHTCDTTHCRAGWVVTLAGEKGKKLEEQFDTPTAAYLIYRQSDPDRSYALNFYDTNKNALEEMKRLAQIEANENLNQ